MFNYIIPVFNKEDILPLTLDGINLCASMDARIYIIIDGCTDRSEEIVDNFKKKTHRNIIKIHMPNVHMLKSVNAAFKLINGGFTIISQDDIVLDDVNLESKILKLYSQMGPSLGVVSLRLGANIKPASIFQKLRHKTFKGMIYETDFISSENDHNNGYPIAENEKFYPRVAAINGPNIVPWSVRSKIGILDEKLAPYGFDDPEYCLRAMKNGFINGVFPIKYRSDLEWGGTRRSKSFLREVARIHKRNRLYIWNKHYNIIDKINKNRNLFSSTRPVETINNIIGQFTDSE